MRSRTSAPAARRWRWSSNGWVICRMKGRGGSRAAPTGSGFDVFVVGFCHTLSAVVVAVSSALLCPCTTRRGGLPRSCFTRRRRRRRPVGPRSRRALLGTSEELRRAVDRNRLGVRPVGFERFLRLEHFPGLCLDGLDVHDVERLFGE